jgi:hypothetical protein
MVVTQIRNNARSNAREVHLVYANFQPCKFNWDKGPIPFNHVHKIMVTCLPAPIYFSDRISTTNIATDMVAVASTILIHQKYVFVL